MKNLISAVLTAEKLASIKASLSGVSADLPFLISLTPEERMSSLKYGDKSHAFASKCIDYIKENPALVPSFLDTAELEKDFQLTEDLLQIQQLLSPLSQKLDDTLFESGSEAFAGCIVFYKNVKYAYEQNVPGAKAIYEDLRQRFPGKGKANVNNGTATPETNQ